MTKFIIITQMIPETALSDTYFLLNWNPVNGDSPRQTISVASFAVGSQLRFDFASGVSVEYQGATYNEGSPLLVSLEAYETFQIVGDNNEDFSGM